MAFIALFNIAVLLVPFTGTIVRSRASYHPKLDDTAVTSLDPSFLAVWNRVRRVEKWAGLWKGLMPTLLGYVILPMFYPYRIHPQLYVSPSPPTEGKSLTSGLISNTFNIICVIVVYRSVTTTHKLENFKPKEALRALFTAHERKKFWVLWMTPGLMSALYINIFLQIVVFRSLRRFLLQFFPTDVNSLTTFAQSVALRILSVPFATIIFAPLDVMVTRLAIQRNYGGQDIEVETNQVPDELAFTEENGVVSATEVDVEKVGAKTDNMLNNDSTSSTAITTASQPEDMVINLRKDPYLGLVDCVQKIIEEEGWHALYRQWWLTFLGQFFTALYF